MYATDENLRHQQLETAQARSQLQSAEEQSRYFRYSPSTSKVQSAQSNRIPVPNMDAIAVNGYHHQSPIHHHRYLLEPTLRPGSQDSKRQSATVQRMERYRGPDWKPAEDFMPDGTENKVRCYY
jgi:hypothetical protein